MIDNTVMNILVLLKFFFFMKIILQKVCLKLPYTYNIQEYMYFFFFLTHVVMYYHFLLILQAKNAISLSNQNLYY